jgi:GTP-binding protein HflX
VLALNKADLVDPATAEMIKRRGDWSPYEEVVLVSARTGAGLPGLLAAIERQAQEGMVRVDLVLPYDRSGLESELRQRGHVLHLEYTDDGISVLAEVPVGVAGRFAEYRRPTAPATARKTRSKAPAG